MPRCAGQWRAPVQEAWGASRAPRLRLPEPVSLDGNVALLQLQFLKNGLLFLYLSLPNWWLHPPPRQENRTKSFHRTLQLLCLFLFFLFSFLSPTVLCPTAGCRGLKTFFLNHSPSKKQRKYSLLGAISCEKSISQTIARKYCLDRYSWCNTVVLSTVILTYLTEKTAGYRSVMHDLQLTTYLTFLYTFAFSLCPLPTPWSHSV